MSSRNSDLPHIVSTMLIDADKEKCLFLAQTEGEELCICVVTQ